MTRREKLRHRRAYLHGFAAGRRFRDEEMRQLMDWLTGELKQFCQDVRAEAAYTAARGRSAEAAPVDRPRMLH